MAEITIVIKANAPDNAIEFWRSELSRNTVHVMELINYGYYGPIDYKSMEIDGELVKED